VKLVSLPNTWCFGARGVGAVVGGGDGLGVVAGGEVEGAVVDVGAEAVGEGVDPDGPGATAVGVDDSDSPFESRGLSGIDDEAIAAATSIAENAVAGGLGASLDGRASVAASTVGDESASSLSATTPTEAMDASSVTATINFLMGLRGGWRAEAIAHSHQPRSPVYRRLRGRP
jgi:microcystin-dependent protein